MTQIGILIGIGIAMALMATIALCIVILPQSREGQFTGVLKVLRDFFLFRYLVIEAIMRFFYIFETLTCIFVGFFLLFGRIDTYLSSTSTAGIGISLIIFGPIITRLVYELVMVPILQLKNVMEINAKIKGDSTGATAAFDLPPINTGFGGGMQQRPFAQPQPQMPVSPMPFEAAPAEQPVEQAAKVPPAAEPMEQAVNVPPVAEPSGSAPFAPQQPEGTMNPMGRTCANCGAVVAPGAHFCTTCGTKLD